MTKLTTHCLDTFSGKPAKGVKVDVYFVAGNRIKLNSTILNNNGRSDEPLVDGTNFKEGQYELTTLKPSINAFCNSNFLSSIGVVTCIVITLDLSNGTLALDAAT